MCARILIGSLAFAIAGAAAAQLPGIDAPTGAAPGPRGIPSIEHKVEGSGPADEAHATRLKDAIGLCDRLGGTERELCLRQAQENNSRAAVPAIGGTPGRGGSGALPDNRGAAPQ
jgi:hypothetical protein